MATLKHIASKNSDYTAIEAYLIYQHDAFTGKQLLDEQGRPMLRDSYILDTLECGDFSFATACLLANRKYNKNNHPDEVKSHQYITLFHMITHCHIYLFERKLRVCRTIGKPGIALRAQTDGSLRCE